LNRDGKQSFTLVIDEERQIILQDYLSQEALSDEDMQILTLVLTQMIPDSFLQRNRNFFSTKHFERISFGLQLLDGYHKSIRSGQNRLLLNLDTVTTAFYDAGIYNLD
jgi:hypothetical protein